MAAVQRQLLCPVPHRRWHCKMVQHCTATLHDIKKDSHKGACTCRHSWPEAAAVLQRAVEDSRKLKRRGTPHVVVFAGMQLPQPFGLPLLMSEQHTNFLRGVLQGLPAQRPGMQPTGRSSRAALLGGVKDEAKPDLGIGGGAGEAVLCLLGAILLAPHLCTLLRCSMRPREHVMHMVRMTNASLSPAHRAQQQPSPNCASPGPFSVPGSLPARKVAAVTWPLHLPRGPASHPTSCRCPARAS